MLRRPPRSTRTDTLFPYTSLFRSNLLLAAFIFAVIAYAYGYPAGRPIVTNVIAGSPAATAGLVPGDEITSFNGSRIIMAANVRQHIKLQPNKAVEIEILRGHTAHNLTATR